MVAGTIASAAISQLIMTMTEPQTLPQYFLQKVEIYGQDKVALRQKELGIWREFTWQESYEQVKAFSLGLIALGLQRGAALIPDHPRAAEWMSACSEFVRYKLAMNTAPSIRPPDSKTKIGSG